MLNVGVNFLTLTNEEQAIEKLKYLKKIGITDLILSGSDEFHDEFYKGIDMLELENLVHKLNLFNSVTINSTKETNLKYLGRCKNLDKPLVYGLDCDLSRNSYYINVHGDIQICKWGHACYLGSILDNDIEEVINYEFVEILIKQGIEETVKKYNEKFASNLEFDNSQDICTLCHYVTSEWKRNI